MADKTAYQAAGVDIDAQERALELIKKQVRSTFNAQVLSDVGAFGGLFQPDLEQVERPVLVASADGVGTKLMVARMADDYSTVGRDLVNHCVNDILVQGARPLFFMDYVGAGVLDPDKMRELVSGVVAGCRENGCVLLGGETAEMPGFYAPGDYELVGFILGLVDRGRVLDGSRVRENDLLIGLPSSGLHTNGFSLARRALLENAGLELSSTVPGGKETVREVLLALHRTYLPAVEGLLDHDGLHAMAHITGGGLTDNVPRVLPRGTCAAIKVGSWEIPEVFHAIQESGEVDSEEMFRVFNMGVGMVLIVAPEAAGEILEHLRGQGCKGEPIGTVRGGASRRAASSVVYDFGASAASEGDDGG